VTLFAGMTVVLWHDATTPEEEAITNDDVVAVTVTVFAPDGSEVRSETAMAWVAERGRWEWLWSTSGLEPGGYRARCRVRGVDGTEAWAFFAFRLSRNPVGG
jgi:hypothetical protein